MKEKTISSELLRTICKDANEEMKAKMETVYSKDGLRPLDITERIKTFEDACEELGKDDQLVIDYVKFKRSGIKDKHLDAYLQLDIITKSLNEGWVWNFGDYRYYPHIYVAAKDYVCTGDDTLWQCDGSPCLGSFIGRACLLSDNGRSRSYTILAHRTKELALYSFKQFPQLWGWFLENCEIRPYTNSKKD